MSEDQPPKWEWTKVGARWDGTRFVPYSEKSGPWILRKEDVEDVLTMANPILSDWESINGPVVPVSYPEEYVERLMSAIEGECDGLAITQEQAHSILRYTLANINHGYNGRHESLLAAAEAVLNAGIMNPTGSQRLDRARSALAMAVEEAKHE